MKVKSFIVKVIIIAMLVLNLPMIVQASTNGYNANNWDVFKNRTKAQIRKEYTKALKAGIYVDGNADTYYTKNPSLMTPYAEGELTKDTLSAMTAMNNYYRWLIGVSSMKASSSSTTLQKGALVRRWEFNHNINIANKPADMSTDFWNEGAACPHNILAMGYTPRGAITGWLNEGYSLGSNTFDTIGHRMALLSSASSKLEYGYAGRIAIGLVSEYANKLELPYTSFPAPGYMPKNIMDSYSSAWNIELNTSIIKVNNFSDVKVKITNLKNNNSYECTFQNGKLDVTNWFSAYTLYFAQPKAETGWQYADGEKYKVEVTGLVEKATGNAITFSYTTEFFDIELPFKDVPRGEWFYDAVDYAYSNDIIKGYNATTFAPNDKLTRGMIVTILYRMENSPNNDGKSRFVDVNSEVWYAKAIKWAVDNGIVHGYSGTNKFGPEDNIIRQDLAGILRNYANYKKKNTNINASLSRFKDYNKVDSYANTAMQWAVGTGVITGNADGTIAPKGNATRAEAAAMIQKYCEKVGR